MSYLDYIDSPLGIVEIEASEQGIIRVDFVDQLSGKVMGNTHTKQGKQQLGEYFAGERRVFDLTLKPKGTDFQQSVWQQLLRIPYGLSVSYQDIANSLGNPKAVRAVGAANGKNPIGVIVPCHRVIGSNRSLTGYAGGLDRKEWLLKHEGITFKDASKLVSSAQLSFDL